MLVGVGVVGRAILSAHIESRLNVQVADLDPNAVQHAVDTLMLDPQDWEVSEITRNELDLPAITLIFKPCADEIPVSKVSSRGPVLPSPILIESIAEKLSLKQEFFRFAESRLCDDWIFCSNTSTLRIRDIASALDRPERFCGMHFFMPVSQRDAVEVIASTATAEGRAGEPQNEVIRRCCQHVELLGKTPLQVCDSPGFIVNRMLSPYLNEAMLLLSQGATEQQIESAAIHYGMPMSPLELIDLIGTQTMFNAGRVYWQAFPSRIDPSPILPALIKAKRAGRQSRCGFYDYIGKAKQRSERLAPQTVEICNRYARGVRVIERAETEMRLAATMWIEAAMLLREGTVTDANLIARAMSGGLGYRHPNGWFDYFDGIGSGPLHEFLIRYAKYSKSLLAPKELLERLACRSPSETLRYSSTSK
ncbi:Fatty acid oxidation complex subunit alpha [Novipirellula aureliae]|uniref:Fatty acid oxidation complex subunit alpha n=2 Tax=Novipirellula aureliae TaxID=2527966 RepID=A0A5C6E9A1_9BACT|nr:Fatty acid oxidation complex subunit alpha [Novipirellula aureliae]